MAACLWVVLKPTQFTPDPQCKQHWPQLHNIRTRRLVKRHFVTARHRIIKFQWSNDHRRWNMKGWQKNHLSDKHDKSQFLLRSRDGRIRIWRKNKTAYYQHICLITALLHYCRCCNSMWLLIMRLNTLLTQILTLYLPSSIYTLKQPIVFYPGRLSKKETSGIKVRR